MRIFAFTKWAAAIAAAAVVGTAGPKVAASSANNEFGIRARIIGALMSLGITDQQKEQIRLILRENQPAAQPLIQQSVQEHRALRNLIQTSPVDESAIRAQSAKVAGIDTDLAVKRAFVGERIRKVLTPDQIEKLKQMQTAVEGRVDAGLDRFAKWVAGE